MTFKSRVMTAKGQAVKTRKDINKEDQAHSVKDTLRQEKNKHQKFGDPQRPKDVTEGTEISDHVHTGRDGGDRR
jgi:hypothetical protein